MRTSARMNKAGYAGSVASARPPREVEACAGMSIQDDHALGGTEGCVANGLAGKQAVPGDGDTSAPGDRQRHGSRLGRRRRTPSDRAVPDDEHRGCEASHGAMLADRLPNVNSSTGGADRRPAQ